MHCFAKFTTSLFIKVTNFSPLGKKPIRFDTYIQLTYLSHFCLIASIIIAYIKFRYVKCNWDTTSVSFSSHKLF